MTRYTCDIHGASRHMCCAYARNESATNGEEVERLHAQLAEAQQDIELLRSVPFHLDYAEASGALVAIPGPPDLGAYLDLQKRLAERDRQLAEVRELWHLVQYGWTPADRGMELLRERLDRALAEPEAP